MNVSFSFLSDILEDDAFFWEDSAVVWFWVFGGLVIEKRVQRLRARAHNLLKGDMFGEVVIDDDGGLEG